TIGNDRVFAPEQPIAAGTQVVLEYTSQCGAESQPVSYEFTADLPGSIELGPAQLQILEQGTAYPGQQGEASFVRLVHVSGDLNGVASALMTHTFTVDGLPARRVVLNGTE